MILLPLVSPGKTWTTLSKLGPFCEHKFLWAYLNKVAYFLPIIKKCQNNLNRPMYKLLTGQNLGRVFNFRSDGMSRAFMLLWSKTARLKVKNWLKLPLGSLPLELALHLKILFIF